MIQSAVRTDLCDVPKHLDRRSCAPSECASQPSAPPAGVILSEVEAGLLQFHCDTLGLHSLWITDPLLIRSEQIQTVPPKTQIAGKQRFEEITISTLESLLSKVKNCKDNKKLKKTTSLFQNA